MKSKISNPGPDVAAKLKRKIPQTWSEILLSGSGLRSQSCHPDPCCKLRIPVRDLAPRVVHLNERARVFASGCKARANCQLYVREIPPSNTSPSPSTVVLPPRNRASPRIRSRNLCRRPILPQSRTCSTLLHASPNRVQSVQHLTRECSIGMVDICKHRQSSQRLWGVKLHFNIPTKCPRQCTADSPLLCSRALREAHMETHAQTAGILPPNCSASALRPWFWTVAACTNKSEWGLDRVFFVGGKEAQPNAAI